MIIGKKGKRFNLKATSPFSSSFPESAIQALRNSTVFHLKFQKIISKFEKYEDTETQRKCFNKDRNKKKCDKD